MPESFQSRLTRWKFNVIPAYWGSGARVTYIASDWREVRVRLPLSWRTRNYVGTIFGGSMYSAVDPFYMIMLIRNLGPEYVVWDKAASIRFKKPGVSTLDASFLLGEADLQEIREQVSQQPSIDRVYSIDLKDAEGNVRAVVEKTVYIARRKE